MQQPSSRDWLKDQSTTHPLPTVRRTAGGEAPKACGEGGWLGWPQHPRTPRYE
jgi:hypothetical protein